MTANRTNEGTAGLLDALGDEDGGGHIGGYREKTEQFIRGLREAAEAGEPVGFH